MGCSKLQTHGALKENFKPHPNHGSSNAHYVLDAGKKYLRGAYTDSECGYVGSMRHKQQDAVTLLRPVPVLDICWALCSSTFAN